MAGLNDVTQFLGNLHTTDKVQHTGITIQKRKHPTPGTDASAMRSLFNFLLLLSIFHHSDGAWQSTLFISPNGRDTPSCGERNEPCRTLDHVYDLYLSSVFNSTLLSLGAGKYNLRKSLTFKNVEDFTILGENDDVGPETVEITCQTDAGFAFFFSQNVTLRGLKLFNCGGWQDNAVLLPNATVLKFKTAINFDYCRNVRIQNVVISGSIGRAAHLYEIGGVLEVTNCRVENNSADEHDSTVKITDIKGEILEIQQKRITSLVSGGGVFMSLNRYTRYRPSFMNVTPAEHEKYIHGNSYVFANCSFLGNELSSGAKVSSDYFQETFNRPFTRGGGLGIFFFGDASNSTLAVKNCTFSENKAPWGGGLQVEFADNSSRNFLLVENSLFERNCGYSAGGGARMGNMLTRGVSIPMNEVRFVKTVFRNNSGKWGGGVSLYGTSIFCKCKHEFSSQSIFNFHSCHWLENTATVGAAIGAFLFNQNDDYIGPEVPFHVEFKQCEVKDNHVVIQEPNVRIGEGTIYNAGASIIFRGKTEIADNTLTALALDGGTVELYDDVEFVDNRGFRGGAMAMYGHSKILLMKASTVLFKNNSCFDKGGAMFIQAPGSPQISYNVTGRDPGSCFFAYEDSLSNFDDWDTQVIFRDNQAPDDSSGHSVFATTLKKCRTAGEMRVKNSVLRWKFIKYITTSRAVNTTGALRLNRTRREIATEPIDITYNAKDWNVSPSQVFDPVVRLVDEEDNSVSGIVNVTVASASKGDHSSSVHLRTSSSLFLADGNITGLRLGGGVGRNFSVVLQHVGRQVLQRIIHVHYGLKSCNPGFYLRNGSCVCQEQSEGVSRCDKDGKTVFLKRGFWAGMVNGTGMVDMVDGSFTTHRCPNNFCNCSTNQESSPAEDECVFIANEMCAGKRDPRSILCGKCKSGFSVVFGDTACFECGNYNYLVWVTVYLVVILGLVMLTMVLDIDAFTGGLNGCLYSYQVSTS